MLERGLSGCFVTFDSGAEASALNSAILQPTESEHHWGRIIRELYELRSVAEDEVWRVCDEGAKELALFANFVLRQLTSCAAPEHLVVPAWAERVWRMTLLLHLLKGRRGAVISAGTAWQAIRLAAWYLGRQVRLLPNSGAKSVSGELFKAKVLKKIRTKAPVSDHTLLRSFHRMSGAKLAETVADLVGEGLVRRENGKLVDSGRANASV